MNCQIVSNKYRTTALFLAMAYVPHESVVLQDGSIKSVRTDTTRRDTYRINRVMELYPSCIDFISVSNGTALWNYESDHYLNADFSKSRFYDKLSDYVAAHSKSKIISVIVLDYFWMPALWATERYLGEHCRLLEFLIKIATNDGKADLRMVNGSCIYLPLAQGMYDAIRRSRLLPSLERVYEVQYLNEDEYNHHPLVWSDQRWESEIMHYFKKSVYENLKRLGENKIARVKCKPEKFMKMTKNGLRDGIKRPSI